MQCSFSSSLSFLWLGTWHDVDEDSLDVAARGDADWPAAATSVADSPDVAATSAAGSPAAATSFVVAIKPAAARGAAGSGGHFAAGWEAHAVVAVAWGAGPSDPSCW